MPLIPHNKPFLGTKEQQAASDVLASGCLVGGKQTQAFEDEVCQYLGLPQGHAVATSTGSSAIFLALKALRSQHVVIPSYVCHSLPQAATLAGATSTIIDTDISVTTPNKHELQHPSFDSVIYPYMYGFSSVLPHFSGHIIEDIAQALGAKSANKVLGTIGDIGVLSFYATKLITSGGQGGMLVSKHKHHIDYIRDYLDYDMPSSDASHFHLPMTEMQAAVGRVQLGKLEQFIEQREAIWQIYQNANLPMLDTKNDNHDECRSVRYRAIVLTPQPQKLIEYLAKHGVRAIVPIEQHELLSPTVNATALTHCTVSLPCYPALSLIQAKQIAALCQQFFAKNNDDSNKYDRELNNV